MRAMVLRALGDLRENPRPLSLVTLPRPGVGLGDLLIRISVCGVCHTELDEIEGRTAPSQLPRVLGHQVVGRVEELGSGAAGFQLGERVGVAWIHRACGQCPFCLSGLENLCEQFEATGRDVDGGYAEYMTAPAAFVHRLPSAITDAEAAPLLCAGAIGYRSLRLARLTDGDSLGLTGFGASAHLVMKLMGHLYPRSSVFVFARRSEERAFAQELGAAWTGDIHDTPPEPLTAIIDTTPVWTPVVQALEHLERGGRLIINAIRKQPEDRHSLLGLDYATHLWLEKEIKSVANVTRADVREFLEVAGSIPLKPDVQTFDLEAANEALVELKKGAVRGAKVLVINPASPSARQSESAAM